MPFSILKTNIPEVKLFESKIFTDQRGFYKENYKKSDFVSAGIEDDFCFDSLTRSVKGVIRGMHFQKPPHTQAKLVSVFYGKILDVAVDMRKNSVTFGKYVMEELSDQNHRSLYIPEGFAHGFCVLSDFALVFYKMSREYFPSSEGGVIWNDQKIGISWPEASPITSEKDKNLPKFSEAFYF